MRGEGMGCNAKDERKREREAFATWIFFTRSFSKIRKKDSALFLTFFSAWHATKKRDLFSPSLNFVASPSLPTLVDGLLWSGRRYRNGINDSSLVTVVLGRLAQE